MCFARIFTLTAFLFVLGGCAAMPTIEEGAAFDAPFQTLSQDMLDAAPPRWRVGDTWAYSDGYGLTVSEAVGNMGILLRTDRSGDWVKRRGLFKVDSMSHGVRRQVVFRSPNPAELFPLAENKRVSFIREYLKDGDLRVHKTSWEVDGRETIEVPAGVFDCWVLVWKTRSTTSRWRGYEKWWYSPDVGNFVRMEYRYGRLPPSSRVLVRFERGMGVPPQ